MAKAFDRILIVMFENQYRSYVMQHPYMEKLARAGCNMTNYFGCFHPSQTNYVASLAGELCNVSNDTPPWPPLMQKTLVDLMQPVGEPEKITWKAYMENYPNDPWNPVWQDPKYPSSAQPTNEYPTNSATELASYFRKHNAFASFFEIQSQEERWKNIVDDTVFWDDVFGNTMPEYCWYTPDIWNDGHYLFNTHEDTNPRSLLNAQIAGYLELILLGDISSSKVRGGGKYNQDNIGLNLDLDLVLTDPKTAYANSNIPEGTLVVITFDEADYDATGYDTNYDGPNQIYTVLLGDMITPGTQVDTPYNHYSLIRTVEENFDLGSMGKNDMDSNWLSFLSGETFSWGDAPSSIGITADQNIAMASTGDEAVLIFEKEGILWSADASSNFGSLQSTGLPTSGGALAMAGFKVSHNLLLVTETNGELQYSTQEAGKGWTAFTPIGQSTSGSFALTSYLDYADQQEKAMLVWVTEDHGAIQSLVWCDGGWASQPQETGQLTDGPITISQLGASLYIVYKERNSFGLRMSSYNTAPFNVIKALDFQDNPDPVNDTSIHEWSPVDFPVGHFAKKYAALQNDYNANSQLAMACSHGEMRLAYRAQYSDTPDVYSSVFGLNGILTAADWQTNGFGTIDQAGWTAEESLAGVTMDPNGAIAMCSYGDAGGFLLVFQNAGTSELYQYRGEW